MAKLKSSAKLKSGAKHGKSAPSLGDGLPKSIMDSAQQIWHAGMGAVGRAQEEGSKLFESLVKEGSGLELKTRKLAGGKVDAVRDAVENRVGAVKERAADTWDRLEKVFEDRVQRALTRLGVPGREDLQALIARVDQLNAQLRKMGTADVTTPSAAKSAAKSSAKKPAASKPARAKSAPKSTAKPAAKQATKPAAKSSKPAATKPAPAKRAKAAAPAASRTASVSKAAATEQSAPVADTSASTSKTAKRPVVIQDLTD